MRRNRTPDPELLLIPVIFVLGLVVATALVLIGREIASIAIPG